MKGKDSRTEIQAVIAFNHGTIALELMKETVREIDVWS